MGIPYRGGRPELVVVHMDLVDWKQVHQDLTFLMQNALTLVL